VSNSITVNIAAPAPHIGQPTEGDGYTIVARELLQGVEVLSISPNISPRAPALIAAHALECSLKGFLWHKGKSVAIRKRKVQHDLVALWDMAHKEGLSISQVPPDWCTILSSGHGPNFYFRYQKGERGTVVHGGQTPELIHMTAELKKLIEMVELATKG